MVKTQLLPLQVVCDHKPLLTEPNFEIVPVVVQTLEIESSSHFLVISWSNKASHIVVISLILTYSTHISRYSWYEKFKVVLSLVLSQVSTADCVKMHK